MYMHMHMYTYMYMHGKLNFDLEHQDQSVQFSVLISEVGMCTITIGKFTKVHRHPCTPVRVAGGALEFHRASDPGQIWHT